MDDKLTFSHSDQHFQDRLSREILISQRLRVSLVAGLISVAILQLLIDYVYTAWFLGEDFPPTKVIPIGLSITVYQLMMRYYISQKLRQGLGIDNWVWYAQALIEVSGVTLAIVVLTDVFQNPMSVLLTPVALVYALLIVLSTLHLNFKMSIFVGGLCAVEFLGWAMYLIWTSETMDNIEPIFRIPMVYVSKALLLFLCGVGAAFVARELKRRILDSHQAIEVRNQEEAANAAKSAFLANMSHEIRTPLNAILGYAQLMGVDGNLSSQHKKAVQTIGSSGNHLLNLINNVLDLSKIEAGHEVLQTTDFDLSNMVRGVGAMFQLRCEQQGLAWSVDAESEPVWVHGDEGKLRQVLVNLLGNAVKFTDVGGISLITQIKNRNDAKGRAEILFEVRDTGPGIPPERQAMIFEPFQQEESGLHKGGTGLGLAITDRYVSLMGGTLQIDSTVGEGTRFSFVLHLPQGQAQMMSTVTESANVHLAPECKVTALVVDDVAENREIMQKVLERVGIDVALTSNGTEALTVAKTLSPDIVFTDIYMPDMSGDKVMQTLFETYGREKLKVVAVSASVLAHQKQAYLDAGFDDFIDKPIQLQRVYDCIASLLDVTFVATEVEVEPEASKAVNLDQVVIDKKIWDALRQAATDHSITVLRQQLDILEQLGEGERQVANTLRELAQQFDMQGVLGVLEKIQYK